MKALKTIPKVWYNFLYAKLKINLHLSTMTKDKTTLLYAIIQGIKFDVGHVIESKIIESTQGRCTRALIHPSLITQLCRIAKVLMIESEEKSHHRLQLPLPKANDEALDDTEDEEGKAPATGQQSEEDSKDKDDTANLLDAFQGDFSKLSVCQAELVCKQQMQVDHTKCNTAYIIIMIQFYHVPASSSASPPLDHHSIFFPSLLLYQSYQPPQQMTR